MLPTRLYLDTARLGLTSRSAQQAHRDFVRFSGEEGCSLYFDRFLRHGFEAWPTHLQQDYSGLKHWQGVTELKQILCHAAGMPTRTDVLIANRSAQLMRLAARFMTQRCQRILVPDLAWPSYQNILHQEFACTGTPDVALVPLRSFILYDGATANEVADRMAFAYRGHNCDGLFLPAVSNDGIRLPIDSIIKACRKVRPLRFVVVDGAQAFCHTPADPAWNQCDIVLAGCHKWLRAGQPPMGVAFFPRRPTRKLIQRTAKALMNSNELDDPLLRFINQLETDTTDGFSETVSLSSLFACRAALYERLSDGPSLSGTFCQQLNNARILEKLAEDAGWRPLLPAAKMQSGILLLQANDRRIRNISADELRRRLHAYGLEVTTYDSAIIRLAMPTEGLTDHQLVFIRDILQAVAVEALSDRISDQFAALGRLSLDRFHRETGPNLALSVLP